MYSQYNIPYIPIAHCTYTPLYNPRSDPLKNVFISNVCFIVYLLSTGWFFVRHKGFPEMMDLSYRSWVQTIEDEKTNKLITPGSDVTFITPDPSLCRYLITTATRRPQS